MSSRDFCPWHTFCHVASIYNGAQITNNCILAGLDMSWINKYIFILVDTKATSYKPPVSWHDSLKSDSFQNKTSNCFNNRITDSETKQRSVALRYTNVLLLCCFVQIKVSKPLLLFCFFTLSMSLVSH